MVRILLDTDHFFFLIFSVILVKQGLCCCHVLLQEGRAVSSADPCLPRGLRPVAERSLLKSVLSFSFLFYLAFERGRKSDGKLRRSVLAVDLWGSSREGALGTQVTWGASFSFSALSAARAATSWRWTTSTSASGARGGSCPRSSRTSRAEGQVGLWQGGEVMGQLGCHRGRGEFKQTPGKLNQTLTPC